MKARAKNDDQQEKQQQQEEPSEEVSQQNDSKDDVNTARFSVEVLIPQHISYHSMMGADSIQGQNGKQFKDNNDDGMTTTGSTTFTHVNCHRSGILWHGLSPILLDAPKIVARKMLLQIFNNYSSSSSSSSSSNSYLNSISYLYVKKVTQIPKNSQQVDDKIAQENATRDEEGIIRRRLIKMFIVKKIGMSQESKNESVLIKLFIHPYSVTRFHDTFNAIVVRTEHDKLQLQTLSAWMATMGGGFFFCKRLSVSYQLARQQKEVAKKLGNQAMVEQCTINEAYNLIYAGRFKRGKQVLAELERQIILKRRQHQAHREEQNEGPAVQHMDGTEISTQQQEQRQQKKNETDDKDTEKNLYYEKLLKEGNVVLRQCQAARLLAKRLRHVGRKLQRYHTTEKGMTHHKIDNYQRIRIVQEM